MVHAPMTLGELVAPFEQRGEVIHQSGDVQVSITSLTDNSKQVKPGAVFVAVKGERVDGHAFVGQALAAGASAVIVQDIPMKAVSSVPIVGL